jgi:hypothetical protein
LDRRKDGEIKQYTPLRWSGGIKKRKINNENAKKKKSVWQYSDHADKV